MTIFYFVCGYIALGGLATSLISYQGVWEDCSSDDKLFGPILFGSFWPLACFWGLSRYFSARGEALREKKRSEEWRREKARRELEA